MARHAWLIQSKLSWVVERITTATCCEQRSAPTPRIANADTFQKLIGLLIRTMHSRLCYKSINYSSNREPDILWSSSSYFSIALGWTILGVPVTGKAAG